MNSYKHIHLWENRRRIRLLEEFRSDVIENSRPTRNLDWAAGGTAREEEGAAQRRKQLNLKIPQTHGIIKAANIAPTITEQPAAAIGGPALKIDTILNLLDSDNDTRQRAVDFIDMALGVYQNDRRAAKIRTFNPFWWLWRALLWFVRIPFVLMDEMGFDGARAEASVVGKLFKLTLFLSAVLTILNYLGWLDAAKALLGLSE